MKSILRALATEYWKRAALGLVKSIVLFVVMPALFMRFVLGLSSTPEVFELLTFHFPYVGVALVVFCSVGFSAQVGCSRSPRGSAG